MQAQALGTTIVCGTDFSDASIPAVNAAAALASRLDAKLWLVHVLNPSVRIHDAATIDTLIAGGRVWLDDQAGRLRARGGPASEAAVLVDVVRGMAKTVSEALLAFAKKQHACVVIVSSQGHSASSFLRVGGTSEVLAQAATIPVLVVRDATPFEQWAKEARPLRVVLGLDRTEASESAIQWLRTLRAAGPCDVVVTQVYYSSGEAARYGISPRPAWLEEDPELERLIARDLQRQVGTLPGDGSVVYRPKLGIGRLGDHLLEVAEVQAADLVVVGTHHKHGFDRLASVSSVLLRYGHASVVCVPAAAVEKPVAEEIPRISRIVVPTDFSELSNRAIPYAYALSGSHGGEVYLIHVIESPAEGLPPRQHPDLVSKLRALVPKGAAEKNVVTRTDVVFGTNPAEAICQAAERFGADVICLSSHGRSGVGRVVMGSVAEAVLRASSHPVFVVRPPRA